MCTTHLPSKTFQEHSANVAKQPLLMTLSNKKELEVGFNLSISYSDILQSKICWKAMNVTPMPAE